MKKSILLLIISVFFITGCDFLRTLAGRPTSKELEEKQISAILAEKDALSAKYDALEKEYHALKDSLSALDSISQYGGTVLNPTRLGGLFSTKLEARYYVIVGAFIFRANAESLLLKAQKLGYKPALINFRNGMMAVGLCPSNNIRDAFDGLKKVKQEAFCPPDVWVLCNE